MSFMFLLKISLDLPQLDIFYSMIASLKNLATACVCVCVFVCTPTRSHKGVN